MLGADHLTLIGSLGGLATKMAMTDSGRSGWGAGLVLTCRHASQLASDRLNGCGEDTLLSKSRKSRLERLHDRVACASCTFDKVAGAT